MKAIRKLVASNGEYKDASGDTKKRWQRVGTMFKGDDGEVSIKLDCIPVGNEWSGWVKAFPMDDNQQTPQQAHAQPPSRDDGDSGDIPF